MKSGMMTHHLGFLLLFWAAVSPMDGYADDYESNILK
jgi:hypothetical protein